MNIFNNKIEMNKMIKFQQSEIEQTQIDKANHLENISILKEEISELQKENQEYYERYINTGVECDFCYTTIQSGFTYCPKCGKKIKKNKNEKIKRNSANVLQIEDDNGCALINQYNGFNDKRVVIPSKINGKKVIGIWNRVFEKCIELEEVIFEEGCQYIGKSAFMHCKNLKKLDCLKVY